MTHKEVITALRSTPSRSKRELLDTAADMIEQMMDKPVVSNADRIRAMSDEELAEWLADIWDCNLCSEHERLDGEPLLRNEQCDQRCEEHCLEWLKQPADHFREATKKEDA